MATRLYFDATTAPALSPTYTATWDDQTHAVRRRLNKTNGSSALSTTVDNFAGAGTYGLAFQLVSPALTAQTISGTFNFAIRVLSVAGAGSFALSIKVMASDGTTLRGVLFDSGAGTPFNYGAFPATLSSVVGPSETLTAVTTVLGDVIVVEIGEIIGGGGNTSFRIGESSASDLGLIAGETNDFNPWVEFSSAITFNVVGTGTTFYAPSSSWKPAPISPSTNAGWSVNRPDFFSARPWSTDASEVFGRPNLANSNGNGGAFAGTNPSRECAQQWVWGPIKAVSVPAQVMTIGWMGHHGVTYGFHWLRGCAWIATPAGANRGNIVAPADATLYSNLNSYPANTPYSSRFATGTSLNATVNALDGDYLVIEIGFENQSGSTMNSFFQLGDANAADITSVDSTTNRNPFLTFGTTNFILQVVISGATNQLMMMGVGT